ncbi:unnamed protein product [marine sediment metagenome]|uniref:Uncharacterized protein n=1 Tax=marine sediment metagenome TaxID=412755 RepID=X1D3J5_9ZZZZ
MSQKKGNPIPIYDYVNSNGTPILVSDIPSNTPWIWSDDKGGGPAQGPVCWGDICPDGTSAHGVMYVYSPILKQNVANAHCPIPHYR